MLLLIDKREVFYSYLSIKDIAPYSINKLKYIILTVIVGIENK